MNLKNLPIFNTKINWLGYCRDNKVINECIFTLYTQQFKFIFIDGELIELFMNDNPITEKRFMNFLDLKVFW